MARGFPRSAAKAGALVSPVLRRVKYEVKNVSITTAAGVAADGFGSAVIGDFPDGNILFVGGISYLQFTTSDADITATWTGSYGIGTTATADNAIATTEEDLITEATLNAATAKVSPYTRGEKAAVTMFDNTDGSLELNLNLRIADASFTDSQSAVFTATGIVELVYIVLGDD
jgi:hypothetical protein